MLFHKIVVEIDHSRSMEANSFKIHGFVLDTGGNDGAFGSYLVTFYKNWTAVINSFT